MLDGALVDVTQAQVARRLGMSVTTIRRAERDHPSVRLNARAIRAIVDLYARNGVHLSENGVERVFIAERPSAASQQPVDPRAE